MREQGSSFRVLIGKSEGKRPLGIPRRRWEHVKFDLRELTLGWYGLDSSDLEECPVAGSCEHCNESWGPIKYCEFLE
jgi:hypothetical protein